MGIRIEQTVYELLPVGDYQAVITDIQQSDGIYGPQLCFEFTIEGGEHNGSQLKAWCSAKFSAKSKLYEWARAAFGGAEIPPTYTFDADDVIGRKVTLTVVINTKDDGSEFNKVQTVKRHRAKELNGNQASIFPAA